ncbi:MAG: metallophosphatase family protein [Bacteroidia bacterium]|nr:metallophosphatase family protein [Bacteroidia bacterium]
MKSICLLSDTHGFLPERAKKYLDKADEIWHAGDIGTPDILEPWTGKKNIRAVFGNIDDESVRKRYPEELLWQDGNMLFYMVHIGGRPGKYPVNIKKVFAEKKPNVFICGHSHILRVEFDKTWNVMYLNPGACGREGFHKTKTLLLFDTDGNNLRNLSVVELEPRTS